MFLNINLTAIQPRAVLNQMIATEVNSCTFTQCLKITPAPKNPTPVTTFAIILVTSTRFVFF